MRYLLFSTATLAAMAFGAAGAMAQTPVPNASGSQVTNPQTYGATAYQNRGMATPAKKRHVTKKHHVTTTGSVHSRSSMSGRKIPVPNASGSQVTNPETYGATAYQHRRR